MAKAFQEIAEAQREDGTYTAYAMFFLIGIQLLKEKHN